MVAMVAMVTLLLAMVAMLRQLLPQVMLGQLLDTAASV
jgi:hypothetical protein